MILFKKNKTALAKGIAKRTGFISMCMAKRILKIIYAFAVFIFYMQINTAAAQERKGLLLSDAINTGLNNYQSIQAKRNYLNASAALVQDAKNQYLPNVIASVQHDYGTINGQYGPLIGYGGL